MGWYGKRGQTVRDLVTEIRERTNWTSESGRHVQVRVTAVRHEDDYTVVWRAIRVYRDETEEYRTVLCTLIRDDGDGAMSKEMDEASHPYYYSCPLAVLREAEGGALPPYALPGTPAYQSLHEWRNVVRVRVGRSTLATEPGAPLTQQQATIPFSETDCGGAFDGSRVTSDADPGL